ncbi:MAG: hypothetical protein AB1637_03705 [Elusimicrobiota bacterium]
MKAKKIIFWSYLLGSIFLISNIIDSETLTITTYYPAPYGGYVRMLTTDTTLLARDGGNVGVGTSAPSEKLHLGTGNLLISAGNATLNSGVLAVNAPNGSAANFNDGAGPCCSGYYTVSINEGRAQRPTLQFHDSGQAEGQIILQPDIGGGQRGFRFQSVQTTMGGRFTGNVYIEGTLMGMCSLIYYGTGGAVGCPAGTTVMGYFGDGTTRLTGYLNNGGDINQPSSWRPLRTGEEWAGWMYCCRIQ